jgi:hypothetical protein
MEKGRSKAVIRPDLYHHELAGPAAAILERKAMGQLLSVTHRCLEF